MIQKNWSTKKEFKNYTRYLSTLRSFEKKLLI